jgi:pre-mRNA-splicing factor 38A
LTPYRYLRALAAFYVRLTFDPVDIHKTLEPFLSDYRKLRRRTKTGFALTYMDQFIDDLLVKDRACATSLWKMPSRRQLEDLELLDERISPLGDEIDDIDADEPRSEGSGEVSESEDDMEKVTERAGRDAENPREDQNGSVHD